MAEKKINPHDAQLQARLEQFIAEAGSQTKAAAQIGYSTATLSTYLKGKYEGDVKAVEAKLKEFFDVRDAADAYRADAPDYVPTSISEQVYQSIRLCHLKGGLAIECGDAGIGKTKAAQKYAADYPASTVYVTANPCVSGVTAFLKLLCRELQLPTGRKDDMWFALDEQFRGGKKVVVVDEAQNLPIKTIEALRALFDSNPSLGIIFVGNLETVTNCYGRGKAAFAQLRNRNKRPKVRHTSQIKKDDVRMLIPALAGHDREVSFLHSIAQTEQGVRGMMNLYGNALDNGNTTYDGLLAAARDMQTISGGL